MSDWFYIGVILALLVLLWDARSSWRFHRDARAADKKTFAAARERLVSAIEKERAAIAEAFAAVAEERKEYREAVGDLRSRAAALDALPGLIRRDAEKCPGSAAIWLAVADQLDWLLAQARGDDVTDVNAKGGDA